MNRRDFIKTGLSGILAGVSISSLEACDKEECLQNCETSYPYYIDQETCTACNTCVPLCGKHAIVLPGGRNTLFINQENCIHCGSCFLACENQGYNAIIEDTPPDGPKRYYIDESKCTRCLACYRVCPAEPEKAVVQENLQRTYINQNKCTHCGECVQLEFCPFGAIHENI